MAGISNTTLGYFLPRSISAIALQAVCIDGQYLEFASIKELSQLMVILYLHLRIVGISVPAQIGGRKVNTTVYTEENNTDPYINSFRT